MALNIDQIQALSAAIKSYSHPSGYFNFNTNTHVEVANIKEIEKYIGNLLISEKREDLAHGLANILYVSHQDSNTRDAIALNFPNIITCGNIINFQLKVVDGYVPTLQQLRNMRIQHFSDMFFVSGILRFLDPVNYCLLKREILCIANKAKNRSLNRVRISKWRTEISISNNNVAAYNAWRSECKEISAKYYDGKYRVVDIQRGFLHLVQSDDYQVAQQIYADF